MLSVSGARGIVGSSMTPEVALDFAAAFATSAIENAGRPHPAICLGRDTRPSSEALAAAAAAGLAAAGARVIDLGAVATPTVAVMVTHYETAGGMIITASHNPAQWNGLKCLAADGAAPGGGEVDEIVRRFRERDFRLADPRNYVTREHDDRGNDIHIERVLEQVDADAIRSGRLKVVLDSINGAGSVSGRLLLEALGCDVVHLNGKPDGRFAHEPEPAERNLTELARVVPVEGAHVGFAQDPDGDRLAIVDESGHYIGEEYTLVLAARRLLERDGATPIVVNLSASRMIDDVAAGFPGAVVHRTPVGEANVAAAMRRVGAGIGGEGNGGVILPRVCWVRDSLSSMALVLELVVSAGQPLGAIVSTIPAYVMLKHRIDLAAGTDVRGAVERVSRRFADAAPNTEDGVRIDVDDGWVHVRPSNTEPIVRVIAEAGSRRRAQELIDEVIAASGLERANSH
jgi:phosphomannomutase